MTDPALVVYVTEECPFCQNFLNKEGPKLFMWLVESTIPYEIIKAKSELLKEIGVRSVPCIMYNGMVIDPRILKFTKENIVHAISTPRAPTFSGMPTMRN